VTPRPQTGNPAPRLFRLTQHRAIINRLGFNNEGHAAVAKRLAHRPRRGIIGVNLGANRDAVDRVADYVGGVTRFAGLADYLAINISSPNTPGLRDFQEQAALAALLGAVVAARGEHRVPILVKIAPDLDDDALAAIAETVVDSGIEGIIVANTTIARDGIAGPHADEAGGLSGAPLFRRSTSLLARLRKRVGGSLVLIGVGGVDSAETAFAKIAAGADLIQLYTGLIYRGPRLGQKIVTGLPRLLEKRGLPSIEAAVGIDMERWAAEGQA
jgi:dihydroorotate dehydrogenase